MMNSRNLLIIGALAVFGSYVETASAQVQALKVGLAGDKTDVMPAGADSTRLVTFRYRPDRAFAIRALANEYVSIEAPEGETIAAFVISDPEGWEHLLMKDNRRVLVKPVGEAVMVTTGQMITDKRSYPLTFMSVALGQPWYQRVRWLVATDTTPGISWRGQAVNGLADSIATSDSPPMDPEKLHFGYRIKGKAAFRPTTVFDDGIRTWILLDSVQDLPAVFGSAGKKLEVLDYSIHGKYMVVPAVNKRITLKLRSDEVVLERGR